MMPRRGAAGVRDDVLLAWRVELGLNRVAAARLFGMNESSLRAREQKGLSDMKQRRSQVLTKAKNQFDMLQAALDHLTSVFPEKLTATQLFKNAPSSWVNKTLLGLRLAGLIEYQHNGNRPATYCAKIARIASEADLCAILWPRPPLPVPPLPPEFQDETFQAAVNRARQSPPPSPEPVQLQLPAPPPEQDQKTDELSGFVSIRISPGDVELLNQVADRHPLARRGAVAREALRRGLHFGPPAHAPPPPAPAPPVPPPPAPPPAQTEDILPPPPPIENVAKPPAGSSAAVVEEWIFTLLHAQTENIIYLRERIDRAVSILEKLL